MLTPELKALVEAEAPKYVKEFFDKLKDGKDFIWNDVGIYAATKTAQFLFDHLSKPSEDDEKAAKEFVKYGWQVDAEDPHDAIHEGIIKGYLAACTQKNAVIAARDAEIAELKRVIERGDEIKNNWENNEYQEAAHYNRLDDQNEKLTKRISELEALVRDAELFADHIEENDGTITCRKRDELKSRKEKVLK